VAQVAPVRLGEHPVAAGSAIRGAGAAARIPAGSLHEFIATLTSILSGKLYRSQATTATIDTEIACELRVS